MVPRRYGPGSPRVKKSALRAGATALCQNTQRISERWRPVRPASRRCEKKRASQRVQCGSTSTWLSGTPRWRSDSATAHGRSRWTFAFPSTRRITRAPKTASNRWGRSPSTFHEPVDRAAQHVADDAAPPGMHRRDLPTRRVLDENRQAIGRLHPHHEACRSRPHGVGLTQWHTRAPLPCAGRFEHRHPVHLMDGRQLARRRADHLGQPTEILRDVVGRVTDRHRRVE
jgi:hypothetical protein